MPTGLQLNWSTLTIGSTTYTKVTGGDVNHGGSIIKFSGDTNIYPILAASGVHNPTISFTLGDVGAVESALDVGQTTTVIGTLADAKGAALGGVTFTCTNNATIAEIRSTGQHAQFASTTITFDLTSSDGNTNPIAISRT